MRVRVTSGPTEPQVPPSPTSQASSVGDVFAFTVEVAQPSGELLWCYFGPNSHVVFGTQEASTRPLPALLAEHVHPTDAPVLVQMIELLRSGAPIEHEFRMVGSDGLCRWILWRGAPRWEDERLFVDALATDVSARRRLSTLHRAQVDREREYVEKVGVVREHAVLVRDANDNVLQRLFAARLRLDMLRRKLDATEAHAAGTIAFQLDQATDDLRQVILGINDLLKGVLREGPTPTEPA